MYKDTITVYNRHRVNGVDHFRATVLTGVDFNGDTARLIAKYGEQAADSVKLHVRLKNGNSTMPLIRQGTRKRHHALTDSEAVLTDEEQRIVMAESEASFDVSYMRSGYNGAPGTVTFRSGDNFDFFVMGEHAEQDYSDDDYIDGFYNYANKAFGRCYVVKKVAEYSVIPHLEIFGG